MLTIQNQTRAGKIFKCTIFVGYSGAIFFYWSGTLHEYGKVTLLDFKTIKATAIMKDLLAKILEGNS